MFQVSPLDPLVLAGAVSRVGVVGGLAAYLPARRASSVDPKTTRQ